MEDQFNPGEETNPDPFLPESIIEILKSTASWIRLVSILGFIGCGLSIIWAISLLGFSKAGSGLPVNSGLIAFRMIISCFIGIVAFFPSLYLFIYAGKISTFCESDDFGALEAGLKMQKKYWKYVAAAILISVVVVPVAIFYMLSQI